MNYSRAEDLYVGAILAVAGAVFCGGLGDGYLWLSGQPTITDLLRAYPRYFYGPLVGLLAFVAFLTTHLYLSGK